ncbi:MAG: phospholipase [Chlorobium sp.]|uniref:alpha/beta hydrolase n=1 Tax=Chlorobium sp. TaxID=1095 RepID=UPI0025B8939C|nr:phospholipase [Chlorobium sp.]MCF8383544.1 phospholipase [Chlorobium sp.]
MFFPFAMSPVASYTIQVPVHGRYLLRMPEGGASSPLLAGFHGYGETAEDEMARLEAIDGSSGYCLCSIEALHPFRTPKGVSGASWMTSKDRDLRIAENVGYVDGVISAMLDFGRISSRVVLHGFSQGAGMACRTAVLGRHAVTGVMLLGGDIPPELERLERMRQVHLARGSRDPLYVEDRFMLDAGRLSKAGVHCSPVTFVGGHGANEAYYSSAGEFLGAIGR